MQGKSTSTFVTPLTTKISVAGLQVITYTVTGKEGSSHMKDVHSSMKGIRVTWLPKHPKMFQSLFADEYKTRNLILKCVLSVRRYTCLIGLFQQGYCMAPDSSTFGKMLVYVDYIMKHTNL